MKRLAWLYSCVFAYYITNATVHGLNISNNRSKGIEIIEACVGILRDLRCLLCGGCPGGGGKIPVMPQYLISQMPGKIVLRNFEGYHHFIRNLRLHKRMPVRRL